MPDGLFVLTYQITLLLVSKKQEIGYTAVYINRFGRLARKI